MQGTATAKPPVADRRMLLFALILGAVAAGLIVAFLATRSGDGGEGTRLVPETMVVVAAREIPDGKVIEAADLALRSIPNTAVATDAYSDRELVVGQTARFPMAQGEQITAARVVAPEGSSLSFQIPKGLRGVTVPVTITDTPAASMIAGDFVDVIWIASLAEIDIPGAMPTPSPDVVSNPLAPPDADEPEPADFGAVMTLVQYVQVITVEREKAAGGTYEPSTRGEGIDEGDVRYVTLALTPYQAQLVQLALDRGKITLTLRDFTNDTIEDIPPISLPLKVP